jgi:hypothetical protein
MPDRVKAIVAAFVNAVKPGFGPTWSLRAQVTLLLPTSIFQ